MPWIPKKLSQSTTACTPRSPTTWSRRCRKLVAPESWKNETRPEGGEILLVASRPELFNPEGQLVMKAGDGTPENSRTLVVARAVLIVRQTRAVQDEIAKVIARVETGDATDGGQGGMGGGMGGGFGGGFFSVPECGSRGPDG